LVRYFTAFPDFHLAIDAVLALDGELLARLCATGTHQGSFLVMIPTGQRVSIAAFEAWRVRDGRCTEQWLHLDILGLQQQLGAASPVVSRASTVMSRQPLALERADGPECPG